MPHPRTTTRFDVHPGVAMIQKWVAELPEKSGKTLEEWAALLKEQQFPTLAVRRAWLKDTHGFGGNQAWWIAEYAEGQSTWDADPESYLRSADEYVAAMFTGPKAGLKPIFDKLVELGRSLGSDVKICPCKTIVPFYRNRVFAEVKPSTRTRIDFSLALPKDGAAVGRLRRNERKIAQKDRLTHTFAIARLSDIDAEVTEWLNTAYERDE